MNILLLVYKHGDDPFWKKKPAEKAAKPSRPKTKVVKRTSKRKVAERISMELDDDADEPEVEVELDSLGSLFMHLINNDTYQEDVEGSQADDVEVIILSSGSDSMPTQENPSSGSESKLFSSSCLLGSNIYFEDAAARGSPDNPT